MFENPQCDDCQLSAYAATTCMVGTGCAETAKLGIFLGRPNWMDDQRGRPLVGKGGELLLHLLARMGLDIKHDVYIDYVIKCGVTKKFFPTRKSERAVCLQACSKYRFATLQTMPSLKAIAVMDALALEAFTSNSEIGKFEGMAWGAYEPAVRDAGIQEVWVSYGLDYLLEKPSETPEVYRVLWRAAEKAGLQPKETVVPPFDWDL